MRQNNKYVYPALLIIFLYLLPYIVFGEDTHIRYLDELDGAISNIKVLARSGMVFNPFSSGVIEQIMNGLPATSLFSTTLNVTIWLFLIFKPFTAYVLNDSIVHLFAFFGMYLLLKEHLLKGSDRLIITASALCFAILPFYSVYGLSIAGQPLLFYAFLNIRENKGRLSDLLIVVLYPLYSLLILSAVFLLPVFFLLFASDAIKNRNLNRRLAVYVLLFVVANIVVNYNLFVSLFFSSDVISHRVEIRRFSSLTLGQALERGFENFFYNGHFHSQSIQFLIIRIVVPMAVIIAIWKKSRGALATIAALVAAAFLISIWHGLWEWKALFPLKDVVKTLHHFDAGRFHFLHPLLWYAIFAISLSVILKIRFGKYIVWLLLIAQTLFLFANNIEYSRQFDKVIGKGLNDKILKNSRVKIDRPPFPVFTFKGFYSEDLFKQIYDFIGRPKNEYRVVSIGMHPSIAQYNGFYTLDAYSSNYPLSYKHAFRKIISVELDKSTTWQKKYFDQWGSRCYIFVSELEKLPWYWLGTITKEKSARDNIKLKELDLNTVALGKMGGEYIFSSVEIVNASENQLRMLKVFKDDASPWEVFLYKVVVVQ